MRILVVEDEPLLADAVAQGLRHEAHAVDVAYDGAAALERTDVNDYDVVVLDRDLPVVHGDDVCRALVEGGSSARILMLTAAGPKVLEFNCRFGDPEAQAVLPRLRTDLLDLCLASRDPGGLAAAAAEFEDDWAVTVVLASAGYPASSSKGDTIAGLENAAAVDGVELTHAGTARRDGEIVTAGGRVLNVTGLGPTAADARRRAYDAAELISFEGKQMRTDIAARAVDRAAAA